VIEQAISHYKILEKFNEPGYSRFHRDSQDNTGLSAKVFHTIKKQFMISTNISHNKILEKLGKSGPARQSKNNTMELL
jgi:hypothetical protein